MLGIAIDLGYKKWVLQSLENQAAARQRKKTEEVVEPEGMRDGLSHSLLDTPAAALSMD
jgi:hypothetical protein